MMRHLFAAFSVVTLASVAIVAHAQPRPVAQPVGPARPPVAMRIRVPPVFAHVPTETTTVNGHTTSKAELLATLDPAQVVKLPSGKTKTAQEILDGVGRSEDKAVKAGTSLKRIDKRTVISNPARVAATKQRLAAMKQRLLAAKAGGWAGTLVEHPTPGPGRPLELVGVSNAPRSRHRYPRRVSPCAFYPGHAPSCRPDFSSIDAPPFSQSVGDDAVVGAITTLTLTGSTGPEGEESTCSLDWDNSVQVFNGGHDVLHVSATETTNAKTHSFSGGLSVYLFGNAIGAADDGSEGGGGSLIDEEFDDKAGGHIPLIGPISLDLMLEVHVSAKLALIGERRLLTGDPDAHPGGPPPSGGGNKTATPVDNGRGVSGTVVTMGNESHGVHCHVGVEPSLDTSVRLTGGLSVGVDDIVDLFHIDLTTDIQPISARLPTHVTLDLQRAPPSGQIAFDSHLSARFMKSQLSFQWQIFDLCWTNPLGKVCLLEDILQIPTSGAKVIAQDDGIDPLDIDLLGGGRAITWKPK